jgi:hypothetical protein
LKNEVTYVMYKVYTHLSVSSFIAIKQIEIYYKKLKLIKTYTGSA